MEMNMNQTTSLWLSDQEIQQYLDQAFQELLDTMPRDLHEEVRGNLYFAGGCIVNLTRREAVIDYDLFSVESPVLEKLSHWYRTDGRQYLKTETENALTIRTSSGAVFQIVTRFYGPPSRVFTTFDFEHCKCFYHPGHKTLYSNRDVIINSKLIYTGEKDEFTLNTLKRLVKFTNRGWVVDNQSLINLHKAIHARDLNDPVEYKKQTIGYYGSSLK